MKTFVIRNIDLTGRTPYYLRIDYRQKENEPCIRMFMESNTMSRIDISTISWSMTELAQSPFFLEPIINLELISI